MNIEFGFADDFFRIVELPGLREMSESPVWIMKAGLAGRPFTLPIASFKVPSASGLAGLLKPTWLSEICRKLKPATAVALLQWTSALLAIVGVKAERRCGWSANFGNWRGMPSGLNGRPHPKGGKPRNNDRDKQDFEGRLHVRFSGLKGQFPRPRSGCWGLGLAVRASCDVDVPIAFRRGVGSGVTNMSIAFRRSKVATSICRLPSGVTLAKAAPERRRMEASNAGLRIFIVCLLCCICGCDSEKGFSAQPRPCAIATEETCRPASLFLPSEKFFRYQPSCRELSVPHRRWAARLTISIKILSS